MLRLQHENLTCQLLPDGTVEITGYTDPQEPGWDPVTVVDVPVCIDGRPVTSVGPEAFRNAGMRRIGEYAFCACCVSEAPCDSGGCGGCRRSCCLSHPQRGGEQHPLPAMRSAAWSRSSVRLVQCAV